MITIRPTIEQDAEMLCAIQKRAFEPLYERYHDEGNPFLRGTEDILKRLNTPFFRYFTILEDGEIVGGISYKCMGRVPFIDELKEGVYYLQRIYIKPERQRNGIARTAILLCEKEFPDVNIFYVDFPEDLVKNRKCYESVGFKETGMRKEVEPGLVLACFVKTKFIQLIKPSIEYAEDIMKFRQELLEANDDDSFAGCGVLRKCGSAEEWISAVMQCEENPPQGFVTSTTYIAVRLSDDKVIGVIDLRHHINNPVLGLWGGHIGYTVRPSERGKGYAKEMLRLNLENCRERNMDKVMVTCNRDNIASEKTILACGGEFENEVCVEDRKIKRYWITL